MRTLWRLWVPSMPCLRHDLRMIVREGQRGRRQRVCWLPEREQKKTLAGTFSERRDGWDGRR